MVTDRLLGEFKASTLDEWRSAAEALLKGASFEKKLLTQTYEGITLQPIYSRQDISGFKHLEQLPGQADFMRCSSASGYRSKVWEISQELPYGTPQLVNEALRNDLANGQTEIQILPDLITQFGNDPDYAQPAEVGMCGVSLSNIQDFDTLFKGIDVENHSVYLRGGPSCLALAIVFFAWTQKYAVNVKKLHGCFESDPFGIWASLGRLPINLDTLFEEIAILTKYVSAKKLHFQTITVSASAYHDAGANAVQELAYSMATGVEYLRRFESNGLSVDDTAPRMQFVYGIGTNFFMELAKLRAARLLWSKVIQASGGKSEAQKMWIHARTATRDKTVVDAYNNVLRGTTEAFAAILGQCNSMHVSPFDEVYQVPDDFSRRMARNTQLILKHECLLTDVIDPAGGSWFIENLTKDLAEKAWELFQKIEADGGMEKGLRTGTIQKQITAIRDQRIKNAGNRKDIVVGVNNYPNPREVLPTPRIPDAMEIFKRRQAEISTYRQSAEPSEDSQILALLSKLSGKESGKLVSTAAEAVLAGASLGEVSRVLRANQAMEEPIEKLPLFRPSALYEGLRKKCEDYAKKHGQDLTVLQLNVGASREYRLRADWTSSFLQVGGVKVLADKDFGTVAEAVEAAKVGKAKAVVICSTDEKYTQHVPDLAAALKALPGRRVVIVAGAPGDNEAAWKAAGVDSFINVRVPNFEFLNGLINQMESLV